MFRMPSRRKLMIGLAALPVAASGALRAEDLPSELAGPGVAVPPQLHALVVVQAGETRLARAFGGRASTGRRM